MELFKNLKISSIRSFFSLIIAVISLNVEAAEETHTPPHVYYLIHSNRLDNALDQYQSYKERHGRHDTEFLQQLGLSVLQQGAKSKDPEVLLMTLFGAGISMNERALDILIRGVNDPQPQLQLVALNFLARTHHDEADLAILNCLRSNELLIRLEAAKQIALKKLPHATHHIESLMGKVNSSVLPLFPQLFAAVGDSDAIRVLRRMLSHHNEEVCIEAVFCAAKAGRDDMLPKIKVLATQPSCALQEVCAYAFGCLKDESAVSVLERLSQSSAPLVRLAALKALYGLDRTYAAEGIRKLAAEGDPYAVSVLGIIPGHQDFLYELSQSLSPVIRLNAILGLLKQKDRRCGPLLKSILIRDQRDLTFVKMVSPGNALTYWRAQPSTRQNYEDFSIDLELSQHFRENVLTQAAELPEDQFYNLIVDIFECQQNDLIPVAVGLLEHLRTPNALALLRKYQLKPGVPLIRSYCALGLYRLGEEGPYSEILCRWVEQHAETDLIQLRPSIPWELDGGLDLYQITPHETSRLLVETFEAFGQQQDDKGINALLKAVRSGNSKNKYALAGLLMRAAL